jgi:S-formylglutathione hydrolase
MGTTRGRGLASAVVLLLCMATTAMAAAPAAPAARFVEAEVATTEVPGPVRYGVLLPGGYEQGGEPLPLVLVLHGGGRGQGGHAFLRRLQAGLDAGWADGSVPPLVAVCPTADTAYLDLRQPGAAWETFLTGAFLGHVRDRYRVRRDRDGTFVTGFSMGGLGALRFAFRHPERFRAVAAMSPAVVPAFAFADALPKHVTFYGPRAGLAALYGEPFDEAAWAASNPASMVAADPARLRASGLDIFLQVGDFDFHGFHEGVEFLHRVLWDRRIQHEYRLVRGMDHGGATVTPHLVEAFRFFGRVLAPVPEDAAAARIRASKRERLRRDGVTDTEFWPAGLPPPVPGP